MLLNESLLTLELGICKLKKSIYINKICSQYGINMKPDYRTC